MSVPINFDQAEYVEVSSLQCKLCRQCLEVQYYDLGGTTICALCRDKIQTRRSGDAGSQIFLRAAAFGFAAALAGAVINALIVNLTGFKIGLIAVLIGYMVGRSVSVGSYHRGGRRYQALAMALTYVAICVEYLPQMLGSLGRNHSVFLVGTAFVISLAAPFLILIEKGGSGLIGLFIIGIGVYEAWKLNKQGIRKIAGPFPIAPQPIGLQPIAAPRDPS